MPESHHDQSVCAGCGGVFTCGMAAGLARCWCEDAPPLKAPPHENQSCYCPECLKKLLAEERLTSG